MTCCIAVPTDSGSVVVGADSAGVSYYDLTVRADQKVFKVGPMVMAFTTSFRMGQLLRYSLKLPEHPVDLPDDEYMSTRFVDEVRKCLLAGGFAKKEDNVESGGTFLVAYRGRVFEVGDDFQIGAPQVGFAAVGCGAQIALGHLWATRAQGKKAAVIKRVSDALEAAEQFSAGVRRPFRIIVGGELDWVDSRS